MGWRAETPRQGLERASSGQCLTGLMLVAAISVSVGACPAIGVKGNAANVVLANSQPDTDSRHIGEAMGSQGNWWTGDYTSNAKLMKGARNDLGNQAVAMGGDYVWVQNQSNAHAHGSLGTDNTTVVGNVYACGHMAYAAPRAAAQGQPHADRRSQATTDGSAPRGSAAQVLNAQHPTRRQRTRLRRCAELPWR